MSNYTTQLRYICESYANALNKPQPQHDIDSTIAAARTKLFDFDYPIFDVNYKPILEAKIMSHYYTREIGLETVGLFKHHLKNKMREIMPYYNQLYLSEKLKFDPFMNTSYEDVRNTSTTDEKTLTGETSQTSHTEGLDNRNTIGTSHGDETGASENHTQGRTQDSLDADGKTELTKTGKETTSHTVPGSSTLVKHADTPLGSVDNVTGDNSNYLSDVTETVVTKGAAGDDELSFTNRKDTTNVENHQATTGTTAEDVQGSDNRSHDDYRSETSDASNQTDAEVTGNHNETSTGTGSSDYFGRLFGKTGSETYSEMLNKFRETFLNIDMDVINELEPLFMLLW